MLTRRNLLRSATGSLIGAAFVCRSGILMPTKPLIDLGETITGTWVVDPMAVGSLDFYELQKIVDSLRKHAIKPVNGNYVFYGNPRFIDNG